MAVASEGFLRTKNAGGTISEGLGVVFSGANIVAAGAGVRILGVAVEDGVSGRYCTFQTAGQARVKSGAAFAAGALLAVDSAGKFVTAVGGDVVVGYAWEAATGANQIVSAEIFPTPILPSYQVITLPVTLAQITGAGDVVTTWTPTFAGKILSWSAITTKVVTTGAKAATLNLEINTTNVTGGALALTSAALTPLGAEVDGAAITADNVFDSNDTVSVEASAVTAFAEGEVAILLVVAANPA